MQHRMPMSDAAGHPPGLFSNCAARQAFRKAVDRAGVGVNFTL
jgi:hypothetical protein